MIIVPSDSIVIEPPSILSTANTGVAVINAGGNRKFIGIEKNKDYFLTAKKRIKDTIKDKEEKKYYWYLTPYNKSIFMTAVENGIEMVFFAIKENETLYS